MQCPEAVDMLRGKTSVWISVLNGVHLVYVEVDGVSMLKSTPAFFCNAGASKGTNLSERGRHMKKDIEQYYEKYGRKVYSYLLTLCGEPDISQELMQETFVRAIASLGRYKGDCSVCTWLCSIAKNLWRKEMRRRGLHPSADEEDFPVEADVFAPSPEENAVQKDSKMFVLRQVHSLPETEKEIVLLRATGAMTFAEIGELFGKTENWARVTFYRAKQKLRKE